MPRRYPVLYAPTPADRAAAIKLFRPNGLYLHGANTDEQHDLVLWELHWGKRYLWIYASGAPNSWLFLDAHELEQRADKLTLVNSPSHFLAYMRAYGGLNGGGQ